MTLAFQPRCYMVSTLHRCSYDNSTISSVKKLKTICASFFFPSFSFTFLFNLFCFSRLCQRVILLNFLDIKVNPDSFLFSQRESERVAEVQLWGGGRVVLGKLSVPGRPTNLDNSRARAYCACSRCGLGLFGHFFSRLSFFFSLSGRWSDIDWNMS